MNSLVTILIPTFNRVALFGETIESALNQSYQEIDIIIVDNFSTYTTWGLLNKYIQKD
jgi:glycosyltransferase involved in cell wall biosynthesis